MSRPPPHRPPHRPPAPTPRTGLVAAAEAVAAGSTQLVVAVLDRVTDESAVGRRGTEPFYAASLSKVVVAVDVLDRRRPDGLTVTGGTSSCSGGRSAPATTAR